MFYDRFTAGLDARGNLKHRFAGSSVISRWLPPGFKDGLDPDTTEAAINLTYGIPNMRVEYLRVEPPGVPTAFWRSVGPSHNVFGQRIELFRQQSDVIAAGEQTGEQLACFRIAAL